MKHNKYGMQPQVSQRTSLPRPYILFLSGFLITKLGDVLYTFAIPWISYELTGSALVMSSLFATSVLPVVIFGPFVGVMVDRLHRRRLMLCSDALRALLVGLIPVLHWLQLLEIWHLYVIAFLLAVLSMLFDVATVTVIPQIAGEQLTKANSAYQMIGQMSEMAGPLIAGTVIAAMGGITALWLNAVSFAGTFFVILCIRTIKAPASHAAVGSVFKSMAEGFNWLRTNPLNLSFSLQAMVGNFGYSVVLAVLVFYMRSTLGLPAEEVGINLALIGAGGLLGTIVIMPLEKLFSKRNLFPAILGFGTIGFVVALVLDVWLAPGIGIGMAAACNVAWNVMVTSLRQQTVPPDLLGRVLSFSRVFTRLAMPAGALAGGFTAAHFSPGYIFIIAGGAKAVEVFIALRWIRPNLLKFQQ